MEETENGGRHGSADLISALPDDLLLQVLDRLDSRRSAARTGLLSRRWRGLSTRLPCLTVTLHKVPLCSLEAALAHAIRPGVCHYYLDICVPSQGTITPVSISSLLRAAAALSPVEMLFVLEPDVKVPAGLDVNLIPMALLYDLPWSTQCSLFGVNLPRFDHATSIDLRARHLRLLPPSSGFPSLERLCLSGCDVDLAALIPRCPRIRILRVNNNGMVAMDSITIHSASLHQLSVESSNRCTSRIDIEAPVLKQLNLSFRAGGDLRVSSVWAPMAEKVSWRCSYKKPTYRLGLWGLLEAGLNTTDHSQKGGSQLPTGHVLSLHMAAQRSYRYLNAEHTFAAELDKHMVSKFSRLDLHLTTTGHAFGALVLRLFGLHRIRRAIQNLRIVLQRSEVKETCHVTCFCGEPKDWRTQTIPLAGLETVEIEGLHGEDHEFDFLKVMFTSARMLKRVTLRLAHGVTPCVDWCTKVNNIFKAFPFVKCNVDLGAQ
ncbi:uncharacterized protein LOC119293022 [Triticum dicoccoides]|uniref:uncharacterized protein LOC119293022 n=1 Tax=Triticum dicoccoides TaxID=85692 RepID=UPI00188F1C89|nr:uncharacterized protein LOC119293022 [Triticum dicoccoides]